MRPTARALLAPVLALASLAAVSPAARAAGDGTVRLEVLVDGVPLNEYAARGTTYVEAVRSREYELRVTNLEPVRVAVAVSVDGRNSIDAAHTTAREARKWVLEPYQSIVLSGWQTGDSTARRFTFTTERGSYAAWLGDVSNAGVIEAVAFRERGVRPMPLAEAEPMPRPRPWWPWGEAKDERERADGAEGYGGRLGGTMSPPPASAPMPSRAQERAAGASNAAPPAASRQAAKALAAEDDASRDAAATGIGREVDHRVTRVAFDMEDTPSGSARIRYEYRSALVRLGILPPAPRHGDRRETAQGFAGGPWCPVPPVR